MSPELIAASLARPPDRSIGIWPTPLKNHAVRRPLTPEPVKYSILAGKVIRLDMTMGRKIESEKDRWLLARIAAPRSGICSAPSTHGRNNSLRIGPSTTVLRNQ